MKKNILGVFSIAVLSGFAAQAQDTYVPYDSDIYHLIDRYQIKYGSQLPAMQTAVRPFGRQDVADLAEISARNARTAVDQYNTEYLLNDNWNYTTQDQNYSNKPVLKYFFRNKTDLYHFESNDFTLRVNPVIHFEMGLDSESDKPTYVNTRGIQLEGSIDEKFGFYTFIGENQTRYPSYVVDRILRDNVVPHEGYWKKFKEDGYDYITARGYLNYALSKHVEIQLGHDRHFIGDGYRSLIYSDYAPPAFFLKLNTNVWRLNYMNLFQELISESNREAGGDRIIPKKYMALHRLGINITDNFNLGVYEQIVFAREKGKFELQYLNPVIFYRAIEQAVGSEDNAMLGADFRWNIANRVKVYGQLQLDEFVLAQVKSGDGWWANKQAWQIGSKYIDAFGVSNLDLQAELNMIRPFTYQHRSSVTNYQHYRQPLAHPMGANLSEVVGIVRYQPIPRLSVTTKAIYTHFGQDLVINGDTLNYGGNILFPYTTRVSSYGNQIGQGVTTNQIHLDVTGTFQLRHNMFVDLKAIIRNTNAELDSFDKKTTFASLAFRWNIPQRLHEF